MNEPILELELNLNGCQESKISFWTWDELKAWIEKEREFWKWIEPLNSKLPQYDNFILQITEAIKAINRATMPGHLDNKHEQKKARKVVENSLTPLYKKPHWPHSSSSDAQFINKLKQKNPEVGLYSLAMLFKFDRVFPYLSAEIFQGVFEALLYKKRISAESCEAEKNALFKTREELNNVLEETKSLRHEEKLTFDEIVSHLNEQIETYKQALDTYNKKFTTIFEEVEKQSKEMIETHKKEFTMLEESYKKKLGLLAPVTYWKNKRKFHAWVSTILFIILNISGFVGFNLLYIEYSSKIANTTQVPFSSIALMLLLATPVIWGLKILVKLFLSQIHLLSDAQERAIMVETFLALHDKQVLKEDDWGMILQPIFRPSTIGIVRDDASPPHPIELVNRFIDKKN